MKKTATLITLLSVYFTALWAQVTPNAGFEIWTHHTGLSTYDTPDNWDNVNSSTAITGAVTCFKATGTDVHSGVNALKLITKQIGTPINQVIPGIATTGTINPTTHIVEGGIPYTLRPDSIVGWYKYNSMGGENGFAAFLLFGAAAGNKDTIAAAYFTTPATNVTTYTRFSTPLVYRSANAVASAFWILASDRNNGLATGIGSALWVDDLDVIINSTVGIAEQNKSQFTISPNPVVDQLVVKNESDLKVQFVLYDVTGHKIAEEKLASPLNNIDVSNFSNGFYIYSVVYENNKIINTGKIRI